MTTPKYLIGNWKSNKTLAQALSFLDELATLHQTLPADFDFSQFELIIAPPFPFLSAMQLKIDQLQLPIKLAVQNLSSFPAGAYTGEVCSENLTGLGAEYAILGHSERHLHLQETYQQTAAKVEQALAANIKPILCLDEPYLAEQSRAVKPESYPELLIAFEPLTAIGSGQAMTTDQVQTVYQQIQQTFGSQNPLIYGGSVTGQNVDSYLEFSDGVLVGSASLSAASFFALYQPK